jgi:hypothetical protein
LGTTVQVVALDVLQLQPLVVVAQVLLGLMVLALQVVQILLQTQLLGVEVVAVTAAPQAQEHLQLAAQQVQALVLVVLVVLQALQAAPAAQELT